MRFDMTHAEWRVIAPLLPPHGLGRARVDDRRVLDAILYIQIMRTGPPWRDLAVRSRGVV
jgi:transposase